MLIIPAIDILGGACVRLRGGDYDAVSRYDDNPAAVAERFFAAGCERLHVVDLDAARAGKPVNVAAVAAVLAVAARHGAAAQVGGGLRTPAAVEAILAAGAAYAILGTAALRDAAFRRAVIADHPGRIIVGVDSRAGRVAVAGWLEDGGADEKDFFAELADQPPAAVIRTDIGRDGMMAGVDSAAAAALAARAPCPLIFSGGVAGVEDVRALRAAGGVAGVVIGKALYAGGLSVADALAAAR